MSGDNKDIEMMRRALAHADAAAARGEVPIGAVLVGPDGTILAEESNRTIELHDPSAHAEILAIRVAGEKINNYRLLDCTLYVTLEPCAMCAGAISFARVKHLVYGAADPKGGGVEHGGAFFTQTTCHHKPSVTAGVLAEEAATLLRTFFQARR